GQPGSYTDVDRPNGQYCYQTRVKDPATGVFAYSNQATATVTNSTTSVVLTSTSAVLTRANDVAPGRLFSGDNFSITFTLPLQLPGTVISASGITDAGGNPWDLNNSTDRVIGPLGQ